MTDDAIYLAKMIHEVYTGKKGSGQLHVMIYSDSATLIESIYSTVPVERKTMRHVVQGLKDNLARGEVTEYRWVDTKMMLADILTKDSIKSQLLMEVLKTGIMPRQYWERGLEE